MTLSVLSPTDTPTTGRSRLGLPLSAAAHAAVLVALWSLVGQTRPTPPVQSVARSSTRVVWLAMPGPSGGGGGGPRPTAPEPTPPRATRVEAPTAVQTPVPVPDPPDVPEVVDEPQPPAPALVADASTAGAAETPATAPGRGVGTGAGSGSGSGVGPGDERGFGGGAYRPGNGVTSPVPITSAPPRYTAAAMRARAQGVVTLECVVEPNGECGEIRIVRSFTPPFGLDEEAIAAARRWRFRPGTRDNEPVPVLVRLEIAFNIR